MRTFRFVFSGRKLLIFYARLTPLELMDGNVVHVTVKNSKKKLNDSLYAKFPDRHFSCLFLCVPPTLIFSVPFEVRINSMMSISRTLWTISDFRMALSIIKRCSMRMQLINIDGTVRTEKAHSPESGTHQVIMAAVESEHFLQSVVGQVMS